MFSFYPPDGTPGSFSFDTLTCQQSASDPLPKEMEYWAREEQMEDKWSWVILMAAKETFMSSSDWDA